MRMNKNAVSPGIAVMLLVAVAVAAVGAAVRRPGRKRMTMNRRPSAESPPRAGPDGRGATGGRRGQGVEYRFAPSEPPGIEPSGRPSAGERSWKRSCRLLDVPIAWLGGDKLGIEAMPGFRVFRRSARPSCASLLWCLVVMAATCHVLPPGRVRPRNAGLDV